ncbi:MAG: multidrug transporter [Desulfuromonadales bacterium GWC2_61_20]|nr:MAG: multidrug transporter [Desulfuromonadales bacterium GWC2_61_20]
MNKRPMLMALLTLGAIFIFFLLLTLVLSHGLKQGSTLTLGAKVGVIEVAGVIDSSREIIEQLVEFRDNDAIKALVLRIDSPGGGVAPSQELHEEVGKFAAIKPVVVSMGSVAASGGYYIAVPAQHIVANPGTITGSIGVIMEFTNLQQLLDKIGLHSEVVKSGTHKDIGSPLRPMSAADRRILQAMIDDVHDQFVTAVAAGRQLEVAKVRAMADGRIFSGRQALAAGLVDELGNLQDAIAVAGKLAEIEGEPDVVYPPEARPRLIDYLMQEAASGLRKGLQESVRGGGLRYLWSAIQ